MIWLKSVRSELEMKHVDSETLMKLLGTLIAAFWFEYVIIVLHAFSQNSMKNHMQNLNEVGDPMISSYQIDLF